MSLDPMPSARELRAMAEKRGALPPSVAQDATKRPKAPSVRPWHPYRSKWEADYAKRLDAWKAVKVIEDWQYEPVKIEIGVGAVYTPDFRIRFTSTYYEFHEVKGYRREAAMVRIKSAARQYPHLRFVLVTKKAGAWVHTPIIPSHR